MQMMFNNNAIGPNKSDDLDGNGGISNSPWANIISIGLRIITTLLGGNTSDGIDKVDNGAAGPMQVSKKGMRLNKVQKFKRFSKMKNGAKYFKL